MIRDTSSQDEMIEPRRGWTRNRIVLAVVAVCIVGGAAFAYPTYHRWASAEQTVSRERLRLATVRRGNLTRDISSDGKVVAAIKPTLFSPAAGVVTLLVQAGDSVTKGQPIASIESPELKSQLDQESAALSSAETSYQRQEIQAKKTRLENQQKSDLAQVALTAAKRELRRAEAAHEKEAISEFDYDKAHDELTRAELEHKHAVADAGLQKESLTFELKTSRLNIQKQSLAVDELKRRVAELSIKSPVTGIVGNLLVENKDAVTKNQPLVNVVDLTAFEVELQVPDSYASSLEPGLDAEISHQGHTYPGILVSISPEVVNSQITARVRFKGQTPENMKQNQRVSARILLEGKSNVLMVERGPFLESSGGKFTYVVDGNLARKEPISTGIVSVNNVEILSGLKEGQTVVISSLTDFNNADTVYLTD
ncbi:MAG TPA: HlyD family efflux transporter periplasmic adaptor subunit [Pseudomonadales bacterium]|nr:HlyD family efflux transporter periplasmic adaptor subunit [Pseudomonadales bacterium]